MNEEIYLSNQNLSELRKLKVVVEDLPLSSDSRESYMHRIQNLMQKIQIEQVQIEQLKYILTIKLQIAVFNKNHFDNIHDGNIQDLYKKIVSIQNSINRRNAIDQKTISFKIIIVLLDYKVCKKYPMLSHQYTFQQLVDIVQEYHLWQHVLASRQDSIIYFFIGLALEYICKNSLQNFKDVLQMLIEYIINWIHVQRASEKCNLDQKRQLLILLHCQLSFKLLKKQMKFQQEIHKQQSIYCLLYGFEDSIVEKITYEYKKYHKKTELQSIQFIKQQLLSLFDHYNVRSLDNCAFIKQKIVKNQLRIRKSMSLEAFIKNISKQTHNAGRSLSKITITKSKIKGRMFIPQRINYNNNLRHRIQFKNNKPTLNLNNPPKLRLATNKQCSLKNIYHQSEKVAIKQVKTSPNTLLNNKKEQFFNKEQSQNKLNKSITIIPRIKTYEECKKTSLNKNSQLQLMICQRPDGKQFKIESQRKQSIQQKNILHKAQDNKKGRISHVRKQSIAGRGVAQKIGAIFLMSQPKIYNIPPQMKRVLHRSYFVTFLTLKRYQSLKQEYPYYRTLIDLASKYYIVKGNIIWIISVDEKNLDFQIKYICRDKMHRVLKIDLKTKTTRTDIQLLFQDKQQKKILFSHFILGKCIYFYHLGIIKSCQEQSYSKNQIQQIKYEGDVYSYNIYVNTNSVKTHLIERILYKVDEYIQKLNQQAKIHFNYAQIIVPPKSTTNQYQNPLKKLKAYDFLAIDRLLQKGDLILVQTHQKSIIISKIYVFLTVKLLKQTDKEQYYMTLRNKMHHPSHTYSYVLSCTKVSLQQFFNRIRTFEQLRRKLIEGNYLVQKDWKDVKLNRLIVQPPTIKQLVRNNKNYVYYQIKELLQKDISFVIGKNQNFKWFFLIDVNSLIRNPTQYRKNKIFDRNALTAYVKTTTRREAKHKTPLINKYVREEIKQLSFDGQKAIFNRSEFKLMRYEYTWTVYMMGMYHFCFKIGDMVMVYKLSWKKLIYICKYRLQNQNDGKQKTYEWFRRELKEQNRSITTAFYQINGIVKLFVNNNTVVASIECENQCFRVVIKRQELTLFRQHGIKMTVNQFKQPKFRNRIVHLVKQKLKFYQFL